jgi:dipicolinate synthase subunit A
MTMPNVLIAGGDKRQIALAEMLEQRGHIVHLTGFDRLGYPDDMPKAPAYVFLPVPYHNGHGHIKTPYSDTAITLADIVERYPDSVYVLGRCDDAAKGLFGNHIRYFDLLRDEAFLVKNAQLTAQAAVAVYTRHTDVALCDARCVVVGFGRIAKFLCALLRAHGADVTATARKARDLELIRTERMRAVHTSDVMCVLSDADVIFNTVPAHVFGSAELGCIREGVLVMELASAPYGMDLEKAEKMGVDVRIESGLPGRVFASSAALAILHAFEREEHNRWN